MNIATIKTVSGHLDKRYSLDHNNRKFLSKNVDSSRSKNNYNAVVSGDGFATIEEAYNLLFEKEWRNFQERQKPSRRFDGTYLEYIREKKAKASPNTKGTETNEAYEIIFSIGNIDDTSLRNNPEDFKKANELLKDIVDTLLSQNEIITITKEDLNNPNYKVPDKPCLVCLNCTAHFDENGAGHIHFTFFGKANSSRGAKYKSALGKTFEQLGYATRYDFALDENGNKIPKRDKNNNVLKDKDGNTIYKKELKEKGVIDFIDEVKDYIAYEMKERYGWEREAVKGGRSHLELQDYKVFRAKEREKEIYEKIVDSEIELSEVGLKTTVNMLNSKSIYDNIYNESAEESWNEYRRISTDFWAWYKNEKDVVYDAISKCKSEKEYLKQKEYYYKRLQMRSTGLISYLFNVIMRLFYSNKANYYQEEMNRILKKYNQLKIVSKQISTENVKTREQLKKDQSDGQFLRELQKFEKEIIQEYENIYYKNVERAKG